VSAIIVNGTLKRIDAPASINPAGEVTYATGAAIAVGVTIDEPTSSQRWSLGASIKDVTAVIYAASTTCRRGRTSNKTIGSWRRWTTSRT
jgi:hypothetical protein